MSIDPAIGFVLLAAAAIIGGVVAWVFLRGRIPASTAALIAQAVAEMRQALGETFTEDDVRALAGWVYDNWLQGSEYYTREQFVELVVGAIMKAQVSAPVMMAERSRSNSNER